MDDKTKRVVIPVGGMTCAACSRAVERSLKKVKGVESAYVNISTHKARVTFDQSVADLADMQKAIADAGYEALPLEEKFDPAAEAVFNQEKNLYSRQSLQFRSSISPWGICLARRCPHF